MFKLIAYRRNLNYTDNGIYFSAGTAAKAADLLLWQLLYDKVEVVNTETGEVVYTAKLGH